MKTPSSSYLQILTAIFLASVFFLIVGCSHILPTESELVPDIEYTVTKFAGDSIHVVMKCRDQVGEIMLPQIQADNPEVPLLGANIHHLKLSFSSVSPLIKKKPWGDDSVQYLELSPPRGTWTFECDITFPFGPAQRTLLPGPVNGSTASYYRGNFMFPIPAYSYEKPVLWRTNKLISVHMFPGQLINVDGLPGPDIILQNLYELLFLEFTINAQPLTCASSGFSIVKAGTKILPADVLSLMCRDTRTIFDKLNPLFPALEFSPTIIIQDSLDGLEGTFSLAVNTLDSSAYADWGSSVLAHEILHFWIGVYTGENDDPWWKEGTTEYLGLQLSSELGISPKLYARSVLVSDLSSNPAVINTPLAGGDAVRDYIYYQSHGADSVKYAAILVYTKGAQVSMILDKIIRESTGGDRNLLKATAALCNQFSHGAFYRAEFKSALENGIGSLDTFFARYVDSPGAIDTTSLAATFGWLDKAGAFGTDTTLAKRRGWVDK